MEKPKLKLGNKMKVIPINRSEIADKCQTCGYLITYHELDIMRDTSNEDKCPCCGGLR